MESFEIQIDDGSSTVSQFAAEENSKSIELYDWQRRAIKYFFNYDESIFEVCTGAGKTFCAIEIIKEVLRRENDKCKVLIVVPKNVIMETGWYKELYDAGISLVDIGIYYGRIKEISKITITNMQSVNKLPMELFDMIILDEIHNYGTQKLLPIVKTKCKYKLGLSATVERMDSAHWNILKAFNYRKFVYNSKEALTDDVLNPFNFYNIGIVMDNETQDTYEILTQEINTIMQMGHGFGAIMKLGGALKLRMLSKMNERKQLVNNYHKKFNIAKIICEKHKNDKVIIFNQFNEQTNKFYWHLLDIGISAKIIHSDISQDVRDQTLTDFKNDKFNVLLTSKVLDEGYNLPKLDVAIIMAGDSSAKQTIQRMGRVLRKKNKTSTLYQVYCLGTIEQTYGNRRANLFKELCSKYKDYIYDEEGDVVL